MRTDAEAARADDDDVIDIGRLIALAWRSRWLIVATTLAAIVIGWIYAYRIATPMYPAQATIAITTERQAIITDIDSIFAGGETDSTSINTEFEVIRSRRLVGELVDRLDLGADPEFNPTLAPPSFLAVITGRAPTPVTDAERARRIAIDRAVGRISVSAIRGSNAFIISILTEDPERSVHIVNTLAELYIEDQVRQKLEGAEQAIAFLSRRTTELAANVEALEQELARRSEATAAIGSDVLQARTIQLNDLRDRIADLRTSIAADEVIAARFADAPTDLDALLAALATSEDPRLTALEARFRSGRIDAEGLRAALDGTLRDIEDGLTRARQQLDALETSERELSTQIREQSDRLIDRQQLEREVEAARLLYQTFFTRLQEASVQQGLETADARILSEAVTRGAASPRRSRILMLSAILGALAGAGIALLLDLRFTGFRTADDLRRETGLPVLASIPSTDAADRTEMLALMKSEPNSVFAEAVRNLRTSLLMSNIDREPQVILVTSAVPGEGKTTLAIALARYFDSMDGKRAILLEADIRRRTLSHYVDGDETPAVALVDVLLGRVDPSVTDFYHAGFEVDVLVGSRSGSNAADLFSSRRFGELMEALRGAYDYIVIDSAPVLAVSDARVLAAHADATAFAVRWSNTTRTQLRQGLDMLHSVNAPVSGLVLTQVDHRKMKTYGYGGQYGYDGYALKYYGDG